ncbi:MAG TPA: LytTR family DNA-binding domain-containing protein [Chitinophagaceae bacterium]|nr:LytTR family DNA-binding domain-containing protein [Chitinophagaceae bacterium]
MITAVIIDDEKKCVSYLTKTLEKKFQEISVIGAAQNVPEGLKLLRQTKPDILFLDIEMPGKNGFELLIEIKEINFDVIFTTAYNEYAIKAIRFAALDYLLKPIDEEELRQALERYKQKKKQSTAQQMNLLFDNLKNINNAYTKISVSTAEGVIFLNVADIIYCEATGSYTQFYLKNKEKLLSSRTLKDFEEMLSENNFFRIHHSYLINMNEIKRYIRGEGGSIIMSNGNEVLVSRRKKEEFIKKLNL